MAKERSCDPAFESAWQFFNHHPKPDVLHRPTPVTDNPVDAPADSNAKPDYCPRDKNWHGYDPQIYDHGQ